MNKTNSVLRKDISLEDLIPLLVQAENIDYWRNLNPNSQISDFPFSSLSYPCNNTPDLQKEYRLQLQQEGYFQTNPVIPPQIIQEMLTCIETVKKAGFPTMFALVYDIFYHGFSYFNSILTDLLGSQYQLIPNFWIYYIEPSDHGKGFEPHRDAEYKNTIDSNGIPTVLTVWVAITDATPLNSCMYIVPANRDPQYRDAIQDLTTGGTKFALEDIRALPTSAGTVSFWDQYVFHWGSRGSQRAKNPRISYAMYFQRGDISPVDNVAITIPSNLNFQTRLGLICRGLYRYSYMQFKETPGTTPVVDFMLRHIESLKYI
ncbi:mitomycin antibiotics/polyketide fumonisin biosynthesis protein [Cylindrospermopsis raciborskii CENA303]|uniref:Mitomycin antibiotics/polyketide fumonisin biosynthesis protein n=1 Tax=Cylindrospermopsis raciborskii CENA303 TaxID=1170769 RepID=A0A1X4GAT7_9CYAN|nr:phytanoyl-CoA dioxygenase family protein [Cylindrospermopsis raciborskii]OSO94233.1 mitomycin antibiotics/polyketide fumonisin biosynthesis protein [Cylindrospermopsis raciborskii CENA303]